MSSETLHSSIQEKEAKVLGTEGIADRSGNTLVDEQKVSAAIASMEQKLAGSPLSPKYRDQVSQKLNEASDKWERDVDTFKATKGPKHEARFKELFEKILKDFEEFEKKPEVREIFEFIEPLYANKEKVCATMNLPVYERSAEAWRAMDHQFGAIGFDRNKIGGIQKLLGIRTDGEIGPEAVRAINGKVYEQSFEIKWSEEGKDYEGMGPETFGLPEPQAFELAASPEWREIDNDALSALQAIWQSQENAGTIGELETLEILEREVQENAIRLKETFVTQLKALESGQGAEGEVADPSFEEFKSELSSINNRLGFLGMNVYEALYLKAYKETSSEKRISAMDISAHVDRLVDAVERCPIYPDATVEANDNAVKTALMLLVKGREPEGAVIIDEVIGEIEKTDVEIGEMSEEFAALNKEIDLPIATLAIYYKAYMQIPEGQRMPILEIKSNLRLLKERFLDGQDESIVSEVLLEAFGRLINGQRENLVSDDVLASNISEAQNRYVELQGELKEAQEKLIHFEGVKQRQIDWLAKTVEENPGWYNFWTPSKERSVTKAIEHLSQYEGFIKQNQEKITEIEARMKVLLKFSLVNQHEFLKNSGQSTRDLLISMHEGLGDDVPEELKPDIAKAIEEYAADPAASAIQKLIHVGKYNEALKLIAEKNRERNTIPGAKGGIGEHDILAAYRKTKDSAAPQRVIDSLSKDPESFAAKKLKEGYRPVLPFGNVDGPTLSSAKIFMVKEQPDGSISYVMVMSDGSQIGLAFVSKNPNSPLVRLGQEHTLSPEKIAGMDKSDAEMKEALHKIIAQKPSFKAISSASGDINSRFAPLQTLFQKTLNGNKPDNFVELAKQFAREIKGAAGISSLRANLKQARADLGFLHSFGKSGLTDEFEAQISKMEQQMSQVARLVESNKIESFCDLILSSDFESDSFGRWIIKDAIPFLGTILAATAAIVITFTTFGVGGVAGLALMAGVGTVAGMVGNELTTMGSHYLGKAVYGDEFSNKTMLGKYITDESVYNPQTGKWEEIKGMDLAKIYGKQFVVGFITTFALLGLGQLAGTFLSKFAAAHSASAGFKGMVARLVARIPKLRQREVDLMNQKGLGGMTRRLGKEFLQETGEEGKEDAAKKIHPALGFMVSLYHCLNGRNVAYKFGNFKLVTEGAVKNGENEVLTSWSYDASKRAEFEAAVRSEYGKQNFAVSAETDGTIVAETSITLKDGTVMKNKMVFKPTSESLSARQLLREGIEDGKSEIERLYGVKQVGDNSFEFGNLSPEGKITLVAYLQKKGFVIIGNATEGNFTAVKGGETVAFKAGTQVEAEESHEHDEHTHEAENSAEVETKYRLNEVPDSVKDQAGVQIHQIYLDGDNAAVVALAREKAPDLDVSQLSEIRVRKKTNPDGTQSNYLTIKGSGTLSRYEKEVSITEADYNRFVAAGKTKGEVRKIRRIIDLEGGLKLEIDEYQGGIAGLVTAEVEFSPGKHTAEQIGAMVRAKLPGFEVNDVTNSSAIKNNRLALTGSLAELEAGMASEAEESHEHDEHAHEGKEMSQEEVVALRKKLLDSNTDEGKKIDEHLSGKTVEIDGKKIIIAKQLLTPSTLFNLFKTGELEMSSYDVYLHKHLLKRHTAYERKNGLVPPGISEDMVKGVEQGMEVFLKSHQEVSTEGREMVRDFMDQTVDKTLSDFARKHKAETGQEVDAKALATLKLKILQAAMDQHIDNPPQYVSHGFDHSLRVMDHVKAVIYSDPAVINNMASKYGLSHAQAELFAMLNGVCHDFGYPDVSQGVAKSQHAVTGSHRFIMEIGPSLAKAAGLDLSNQRHHELLANFARCIQCHSADKVETSWKDSKTESHNLVFDTKLIISYEINDVTFTEEIICQKEHLDEVKAKITKYFEERFGHGLKEGNFQTVEGNFSGRHFDITGSTKESRTPGGIAYRPAELINPDSPLYDPLLAATRYADNLDMDPSRFSEFQRSPLFTNTYTRIGAERSVGDRTLSDHVITMMNSEAKPEAIEEVLKQDGTVAVIYEGEFCNMIEAIVEGDYPVYKKIVLLRELKSLLDRRSVKIGRYGSNTMNDSRFEVAMEAKIEEFIALLNDSGNDLIPQWVKSLRSSMTLHIFNEETATMPDFKSDEERAKYEAEKAIVKQYLESISGESFRHFGGCNPIESTSIDGGVVKIKMREDIVLKYKSLVAKEKGDGGEILVPISIYQVWRAVEAYKSLTINGEPAKFEIKVGGKIFNFDPYRKSDGKLRETKDVSSDFVKEFRQWQRSNL